MEDKRLFMVNPILYNRLGENPVKEQIERIMLEYKNIIESDENSIEELKILLKKKEDSVKRVKFIIDRLEQFLRGGFLYDDWFIEYLMAPNELKKDYEDKYFEGKTFS